MSSPSQLAPTVRVVGSQAPEATQTWTQRVRPLRIFAVFLSCLGLVLLLQLLSGAYGAELGHAPDEPSHVVTALMLRDYIHAGFPEKPLAYGQNYYIHYPKVGLGVWPPLFYVVAMAWMLVFGVSKTSLLWFMAAQCAAWATLVFYFSRRLFDVWTASVIAAVTICMPLVQYGTTTVMLDVAISLLQLWSTMCLLRFLRTGRTRSAVAFGFLTAAAMLTKGNSNCLILMAPILLALSRRWYLLKRPGLYVAGLIVVLCGAPWQFVSMRMFQGSQITAVDLHSVSTRFSGYMTLLARQVGYPVTVLAVVGFALVCLEIWRSSSHDSSRTLDWAGAVALFAAVMIFHAIAPVPGPDNRYLTPVVPLMLMFAAAGLHWIARKIPIPAWSPDLRAAACGVIFLLLFSLRTFAIPSRPELGFGYAADFLTAPTGPRSDVFLICSDAEGEGAFITEVAMRDHRPDHVVLRGTKVLSENEWHVTVYRPLFKSPEELREYLNSVPVDALVVDSSKVIWPADRDMLLAAIQGQPQWRQVADIPAKTGSRHLVIYRNFTPRTGKQKNIRFNMRFRLGHDLELH